MALFHWIYGSLLVMAGVLTLYAIWIALTVL